MSFVRSVTSSCWHRCFTQITVVWQTKALLPPSCFALAGRRQSWQKQQQSLDRRLFPGELSRWPAQFTDSNFWYSPRAPCSFCLGPWYLMTEDSDWLMSFSKFQSPSFWEQGTAATVVTVMCAKLTGPAAFEPKHGRKKPSTAHIFTQAHSLATPTDKLQYPKPQHHLRHPA